jgi:hypothetical protein
VKEPPPRPGEPRRPAPELAAFGGLCPACRHARPVTSSKGGAFLLCGRAALDPSYPRYPPQPVMVCRGHQR